MITVLQLAQVIASGYSAPRSPVLPDGWALVDTILMRPHWIFETETLVAGYLMQDNDGALAIVFLGTQDAHQWALNFDSHAVTVTFPDGYTAEVEHGFLRMFNACTLESAGLPLKDWLTAGPLTVTLSGHSLGGALAAISARYVKAMLGTVRLVTMGCPRPGDGLFSWRVSSEVSPDSLFLRNIHDVVPNVPPWLSGLRARVHFFDSDELGIPHDAASRHKMPCYLAAINTIGI